MTASLTDADRRQLEARGIPESEALRQLELFRGPPPAVDLDRPCTLEDGVEALSPGRQQELQEIGEHAGRQGRLTKFVPASGAASRMFQRLTVRQDTVEAHEDGDLLRFISELERFPFIEELRAACAADGASVDKLLRRGEYRAVVDCLLRRPGLGYSDLPKGLLLFHRYGESSRTAFGEHLMEAIPYVHDAGGVSRFHFTVAGDHEELFERELRSLRPELFDRFGAELEVSFSQQSPATDTLAVDLDNRPFRLADGGLLLRPGGHGALIGNLNDLSADIVLLQNVDNVARDRDKPLRVRWKQSLVGYLVELQERIFEAVEGLANEAASLATIEAAHELAVDELRLPDDELVRELDRDATRRALFERLDRPLRVCGVVPNRGEAGGGPFWVNTAGYATRQIVETSQMSDDQRAIAAAGTHFNPVDIVCGVRDWRGGAFDLHRYVDPGTVFIATRSRGGRELKALERPGLWNGAMAHWTTVFVEVPEATFSPVKSVFDLLRPPHQPAADGG